MSDPLARIELEIQPVATSRKEVTRMCDSSRLVQPSCTADAVLMLRRAVGYLTTCDAPADGTASETRGARQAGAAGEAGAASQAGAAGEAGAASQAGTAKQAGTANQAGAASQVPAASLAGTASETGAASLAREFASGGAMDQALPDAALVGVAEEVTGPDGRCAAASDDALIGVLRFWQRQESRAGSRKLAVIAELIRRRPAPGCEPRTAGGMPRAWDEFCGDELAAATACSGQAAEKTLTLAYDLAGRLPGTALALHDGEIDVYKARIISDASQVLDDAGAAAAEALVLPGIAGKTPGQIRAAIAQAVVTIDPEAARLRREMAQKDARCSCGAKTPALPPCAAGTCPRPRH